MNATINLVVTWMVIRSSLVKGSSVSNSFQFLVLIFSSLIA